MNCKNCGEQMIGDGFSTVYHCPNVDVDGLEPDANAVFCTEEDLDFLTEVRKLITAEWGSKYVPERDAISEDGLEKDNFTCSTYIVGISEEGKLIYYREEPVKRNGYTEDLPYLMVHHFHKG